MGEERINSEPIRFLLISVGTTHEPIRLAIERHRPTHVCFLISSESRATVEQKVLPALSFRPTYAFIETPDFQDLGKTYAELLRRLPEKLKEYGVPDEALMVDYTGGTKTMSAAAVLASIERCRHYLYTGGSLRSDEGGRVITGEETLHEFRNPWNEIAWVERRDIAALFNRGLYENAATLAHAAAERTRTQAEVFKGLARLIEGYSLWDRFKHGAAIKPFDGGCSVIGAYLEGQGDKGHVLSEQLRSNRRFLVSVVAERQRADGGMTQLALLDLLANARRRADIDHRLDDAVARLYRFIEGLAQIRLREAFGIRTSDVRLGEAQISEDQRRRLTQVLPAPTAGRQGGQVIHLALQQAYDVLRTLGDELGRRFDDLGLGDDKGALKARNLSILAHGAEPVERKTFDDLYNASLTLSGFDTADLPTFPVLEL